MDGYAFDSLFVFYLHNNNEISMSVKSIIVTMTTTVLISYYNVVYNSMI